MRFLVSAFFLITFSIFAVIASGKAFAYPIDNQITEPLEVFTFGSCNDQKRPQILWDDIASQKPDFFLWLGDNVYADTEKFSVMNQIYKLQNSFPEYETFKKHHPVIGVWDDHDYGKNDGGGEYVMKKDSMKAFLDFMEEPKTSPRWKQQGVYTSYTFGEKEKQAKLILLDLRYNREDHKKGADAELLGKEQWNWLEKEILTSKARIHFIGVSYSAIAKSVGRSETLRKHKNEYRRLMKLLKNAPGVIFLTGDRHLAGFSKRTIEGREYYELMSSGLNKTTRKSYIPILKLLYGSKNLELSENFGLIKIFWDKTPLEMEFTVGLDNGKFSKLKKSFVMKKDLWRLK